MQRDAMQRRYDPLGAGFDDANANALNMGTAEEITLPEDNLSAIEAVAPDMDGFGEESFTGGGGVEPMPFLDETTEDIEVGRDHDVDQSFQLQDDGGFGGGATADPKDISMGGEEQIEEIPMDQSGFGDGSAMGGGMGDQSGFGDDFGFGDVSMVPSEAGQDESLANASSVNISAIGDISTTSSSAAAAAAAAVVEGSRPPTRFGDEIEEIEEQPAAARPLATKRKRKILIDSSLEIPSAEMRKGLGPHGPDDISRQPYHKKRGPYDYDRPAYSDKMHAWRLQDTSAEAMLTRPSITGLAPELLAMFTRNYVTTPRPEEPPSSAGAAANGEESAQQQNDDIEVGRNPDQEDLAYLPEDGDLPPLENEAGNMTGNDMSTFEPDQLPDDSILGDESRFGGNASGLDETLDSATANASAVASSAFEFSGIDGEEHLITSEEYEEEHLTKRTQKMMSSLKAGFEDADEISYAGMTAGKNRRTAAACFFELLVIKTKGFIDVKQPEPYADIIITPTDALMSE